MTILDDLRAYWEMDELDGNRVDSVNDNDAVEVNDIDSHTVGVPASGVAALFNGTNEYFNCGSRPGADGLDDVNPFSFAGWLNFDAGIEAFGTVFCKEADSFMLRVRGGWDGRLEFYRDFDDTIGHWRMDDIGDIPNATWTHFVLTYDGTNVANDPIFYIDSVPANITEVITPIGTVVTDDPEFFLLGVRSLGSLTRFFKGMMTGVGFWNKILTQQEISKLWNDGDGYPYPFVTGGGQVIWMMSKMRDFFKDLREGLIPPQELQRRYRGLKEQGLVTI